MLKRFFFGPSYTVRQKEIQYFIQSNFNLKPRNINFYEQALTHKSYSTDKSKGIIHNERLEFLGDAIISSVVAEILYLKYPKKTEGQLTQMRARIVSRENLNTIGDKLGLEPLIQYQKTKNKFNSLLGNTFESLIGAMVLDFGYKKTAISLKKHIFNESLNFDEKALQNIDYKSQLIIQCQKEKKEISFQLIDEVNEEHGKIVFTMAVNIDGEEKARASSSTKRKAEQKAAKQLLD
jgi:ribonuclease-3